jgi:hypothetical protein
MKRNQTSAFARKTTLALTIIISIFFVACKKDMTQSDELSLKTSQIKPDVVDCGEGYHWDFTLHQCVPNCQSGYVYCPNLGYCVPSGLGCETRDSIIIVQNPGNPNDYVGPIHNDGCDYILPRINFNSPNVYNDLLYQDKIYVFLSGYDSASVSQAYLGGSQTGYLYNPDSGYTSNPSLLISKLFADGRIGSTAQTYFSTLISYLNNIIGNNSPSSSVYSSFASNLISLESQINSNPNLSSNERTVLLSSCAVARYSAGYWGEYMLSGNGINSSGGGGDRFSLFGIHINWRKVVGADIVGGIGGFFATLCTGGGIIAGTIGGAIGGSVGEIVIEQTNLM